MWMLESVTTWGSKTQGFVSELPSHTPILVGQKSLCRRGGCCPRPPLGRARVGRGGSVGGAGSCAEAQGQARATVAVAPVSLPGPTTEPPPPGRGRAQPAGPRGGAGRQLDPAAIYGPFRRAGASSGRSLSRASHNGAAAAVEPPPPRLEACTGATAGPGRCRSPGSVHPSFHSCSGPPVLPSIHSSVFPSFYLPIHPVPPCIHPPPPMHPCSHAYSPQTAPPPPPAQRPCCTRSIPPHMPPGPTGLRGPRAPTVRPRLRRPAPPAPSGTRVSAGLARPAPPRPGRTHRGPFFWAPRNHMSNPRRRSSPPLIQAQNVPQQRTIATLFMSIMDANRARKKKNHLTPRDSQLITNHM